MDRRTENSWLIEALGIFLPVLFLWIILVIWITASPSGKSSFLLNLKSNLAADYSSDIFGGTLKVLQLAILDEIFGDAEISSEARSKLERDLWGPVPTATGQEAATAQNAFPTATSTIPPEDTPTITLTPPPSEEAKPTATSTMTPVSTPTKTKSAPTETPAIAEIIPILECITKNADHSYRAYWGYKSHNDRTVEIPIGSTNRFSPEPIDRGQPTSFAPGRSPEYPQASFAVIFNGDVLTWHLNGKEAKASSSSPFCKNEAQPAPSPTPADSEPPQISGGTLDPPPGDFDVCAITITVTDLEVSDPAPSSGIKWVKLKYYIDGYTNGWIFSDPLTLCSGGPTQDGGWLGCYSGSIFIEINPNWDSPAPNRFWINLYAKARDQAGNETCHYLAKYSMPAECGKTP